MSDYEIVPAAEMQLIIRRYRFMEIDQLRVGEAVFVPDVAIAHEVRDPAHLMRNHAYYRGRRLGRKFRTMRGMRKAQLGTYVERVE